MFLKKIFIPMLGKVEEARRPDPSHLWDDVGRPSSSTTNAFLSIDEQLKCVEALFQRGSIFGKSACISSRTGQHSILSMDRSFSYRQQIVQQVSSSAPNPQKRYSAIFNVTTPRTVFHHSLSSLYRNERCDIIADMILLIFITLRATNDIQILLDERYSLMVNDIEDRLRRLGGRNNVNDEDGDSKRSSGNNKEANSATSNTMQRFFNSYPGMWYKFRFINVPMTHINTERLASMNTPPLSPLNIGISKTTKLEQPLPSGNTKTIYNTGVTKKNVNAGSSSISSSSLFFTPKMIDGVREEVVVVTVEIVKLVVSPDHVENRGICPGDEVEIECYYYDSSSSISKRRRRKKNNNKSSCFLRHNITWGLHLLPDSSSSSAPLNNSGDSSTSRGGSSSSINGVVKNDNTTQVLTTSPTERKDEKLVFKGGGGMTTINTQTPLLSSSLLQISPSSSFSFKFSELKGARVKESRICEWGGRKIKATVLGIRARLHPGSQAEKIFFDVLKKFAFASLKRRRGSDSGKRGQGRKRGGGASVAPSSHCFGIKEQREYYSILNCLKKKQPVSFKQLYSVLVYNAYLRAEDIQNRRIDEWYEQELARLTSDLQPPLKTLEKQAQYMCSKSLVAHRERNVHVKSLSNSVIGIVFADFNTAMGTYKVWTNLRPEKPYELSEDNLIPVHLSNHKLRKRLQSRLRKSMLKWNNEEISTNNAKSREDKKDDDNALRYNEEDAVRRSLCTFVQYHRAAILREVRRNAAARSIARGVSDGTIRNHGTSIVLSPEAEDFEREYYKEHQRWKDAKLRLDVSYRSEFLCDIISRRTVAWLREHLQDIKCDVIAAKAARRLKVASAVHLKETLNTRAATSSSPPTSNNGKRFPFRNQRNEKKIGGKCMESYSNSSEPERKISQEDDQEIKSTMFAKRGISISRTKNCPSVPTNDEGNEWLNLMAQIEHLKIRRKKKMTNKA
eukprot:jgi/Bigna1/83594/fgenesh1_pg.111_\